jgi:hypothetical protein
MSLSHDEQPLTRRQLREMEKQKPRKEREADAKAAEEAEAARKAQAEREAADAAAAGVVADDQAPSRRELRHGGPADAVPAADAPAVDVASADEGDDAQGADAAEPSTIALPVAAAPEAEAAGSAWTVTPEPPVEEDTVVPEIVSDDEPVDDPEPSSSAEPVINVVPVSAILLDPVDEADDAEIVPTGETPRDTVVEEMVIDVPIAETVDPTAEAAAHVEAEERQAAAAAAAEPLAPQFESPTPRVDASDLPSSFDDLISVRNTAATNSISTTSALVLPSVPGSGDVGTALDETGEVIITGSIDLPPSFGATGAPASGIEAHDLDALLERGEVEQGSDVAPVSASRAISTNTGATSLIAPPKRARANAPVVLAVTAAVLAVGVVGLLLAVFVFRAF